MLVSKNVHPHCYGQNYNSTRRQLHALAKRGSSSNFFRDFGNYFGGLWHVYKTAMGVECLIYQTIGIIPMWWCLFVLLFFPSCLSPSPQLGLLEMTGAPRRKENMSVSSIRIMVLLPGTRRTKANGGIADASPLHWRGCKVQAPF